MNDVKLLNFLDEVLKSNSEDSKLYRAARNAKYPNGEILIKLQGVYLLDEAKKLVDSGCLSDDDYDYFESKLIQY